MKTLIQRVREACVEIDSHCHAQIGPGLLVLLGIHHQDTAADIPWLVQKVLNLRIFEDEFGKMNRSLIDIDGQMLIVSQFTLYGNCNSGRRPDFLEAAKGEKAEFLYNQFVNQTKSVYPHVQTGVFGANMQVHLINDGPVTLMIETPKLTKSLT